MSERLGIGSVDDSERYYVGTSPVCEGCRHRIAHSRLCCAAFPERIPRDIWNGRNDHRSPYPGDRGIRFAPMTDDDRRRDREIRDEIVARSRLRTDEMRARRGLPPIDWQADQAFVTKRRAGASREVASQRRPATL